MVMQADGNVGDGWAVAGAREGLASRTGAAFSRLKEFHVKRVLCGPP